eukprot:scaffold26273_cov67-Isochrysis_galbana.AAC.2
MGARVGTAGHRPLAVGERDRGARKRTGGGRTVTRRRGDGAWRGYKRDPHRVESCCGHRKTGRARRRL